MNARTARQEDVQGELEQLVAHIRARGVGEVLPRPSDEAIRQFVEHLRDEEPMSAKELLARERQWRTVEEETRAIEETDARADKQL